jgi:hypothetical protein
MKNESLTSLIILLVLFFVLPYLFKLLGQYTLGSKGLEKRAPEDEEQELQAPREEPPGHPEKYQQPSKPFEQSGRDTVSNRPINPRWF